MCYRQPPTLLTFCTRCSIYSRLSNLSFLSSRHFHPTLHNMASLSQDGDAAGTKRKASLSDKPISPPPVKRKAQSAISQGAIASFFTPTSQKPKDRIMWTERSWDDGPATLLVGRYEPEGVKKDIKTKIKQRTIHAFDLDSTLIVTASGKKFGHDAADWKWWAPNVPIKLKETYHKSDHIVIFSNQGGLTLHPDPNAKQGPKNVGKNRVANFKQKCAAILSQLDIPVTIYAATARDQYRKPRTGMWREMCADYGIPDDELNRDNCCFIGDAGGRIIEDSGSGGRKDFSASDFHFACNLGIKYITPETFFHDEAPYNHVHIFDPARYLRAETGDGKEAKKETLFEKTNTRDIVLFCGPPGAGKSTFFSTFLKPLGYERVNQDTLKTRAKCFKAATQFLDDGCSVVIDNTNPDPDGRKDWIELARKLDVPIRCVWFNIPRVLCEHNDTVRALNKSFNPEARTALPALAFNGYFARMREPTIKEGFQDIVPVEFSFRGTKEQYAIWSKFWV